MLLIINIIIKVALLVALAEPRAGQESTGTCGNGALLSSSRLADFKTFESDLSQLYKRLHSSKATEEDRQMDRACRSEGILYGQVRSLANLLDAWLKFLDSPEDSKPEVDVCGLEFAQSIVHISQQIDASKQFKLQAILRQLANRVASWCKSTLAQRLSRLQANNNQLANQLNVILGHLLVGRSAIERHSLFEPEQYVPISEIELDVAKAYEMATRKSANYEFKLTKAMRVALDSVRGACGVLKSSLINTLAPIGLLASEGFAGVTELLDQQKAYQKATVRLWTAGAILCQASRSLSKVSKVSEDDKLFAKLEVGPTRESDFDLDNFEGSPDDLEFIRPSNELIKKLKSDDIQPFDSFRYARQAQANLRKLQLLNGPNYRTSLALNAYLDASVQDPARRELMSMILGQPEPVGINDGGDEEEEDDEEEEEEEEDKEKEEEEN